MSLLEINGTVFLSLPWLPEAFHARFRPKTCRPSTDEAPCRALEKTSGTHTCSLLRRVFFFVSWNTGTPSSRMRIVLRNKYYKAFYGKFIDRYSGLENRNKNRSKLLTLSPCLVCGTFLAFLAGLERATVELKLTRIARKRPEMLRTYHKQDKETR